MKRTAQFYALLLAIALLAASCQKTASGEPEQAQTHTYQSRANALSFLYPADWTVSESGAEILIASPEAYGSAIILCDITDEVSLFLAGYGDLLSSATALLERYAQRAAGETPLTFYDPEVYLNADGSVAGDAEFAFVTEGVSCSALVGIAQHGGRVILDMYVFEDGSPYTPEERSTLSMTVFNSLVLDDTDVPLEPADLTALGFPAAPGGFFSHYNPITGCFLFCPDSCTILSSAYETSVVIYHEASGSYMIARNWTDSFEREYAASGGDLEGCYNAFLFESGEALETAFGEIPDFTDLRFQEGGDNGELIRARFDATVSNGSTVDCFAELSVRSSDGSDYIQGIFFLYGWDHESGRRTFNSILDSTRFVFPEL